MFILNTNEEKKRPQDAHSARLQQSLKPEWYQLPALKLAIEPTEITNVEFDRDLGPLNRKMIVPGEKRVFDREQRKIFDKMTSFETLDEIYLMIISGMAPIGRITYLEKLAPLL